MDVPGNVIKEIEEKGGVLAKLYFDMYAKDEKPLIELAVGFAAGLKKAEGALYVVAEVNEPEKQENGSYATYVEALIGFKDIESLFATVLAYSPINVEIIAPEKFELDDVAVENLLKMVSDVTFQMKMKIEEVNPKRAQVAKLAAMSRLALGKKLMKEVGDSGDAGKQG